MRISTCLAAGSPLHLIGACDHLLALLLPMSGGGLRYGSFPRLEVGVPARPARQK